MDKDKLCQMGTNLRSYALEIIGVVMLVIGTMLTIASLNGFGIIALIVVGAILCSHRQLCHRMHQKHCDEEKAVKKK